MGCRAHQSPDQQPLHPPDHYSSSGTDGMPALREEEMTECLKKRMLRSGGGNTFKIHYKQRIKDMHIQNMHTIFVIL